MYRGLCCGALKVTLCFISLILNKGVKVSSIGVLGFPIKFKLRLQCSFVCCRPAKYEFAHYSNHYVYKLFYPYSAVIVLLSTSIDCG